MNGASTIGRLGSAYICKYANPLHVHCAVTLVASFLCFFLWTFAATLPAAVAFVVIFGAFSGSVIGLPPASMAAILHNDNARLGQWTGWLSESLHMLYSYSHIAGMMYSMASVFALTGPVIAGYLISWYGYNFVTVQCWSGGCLLVSAFCMAMASVYDDPPKLSKHDDGNRTGSVESGAEV